MSGDWSSWQLHGQWPAAVSLQSIITESVCVCVCVCVCWSFCVQWRVTRMRREPWPDCCWPRTACTTDVSQTCRTDCSLSRHSSIDAITTT